MTKSSLFQSFGAAICRDQRRAEALRDALERLAFDGTECHRTINSSIRRSARARPAAPRKRGALMTGRYVRDKGARRERAIVRLLEMAGLAATKISRTGYTGADLSIPLLGRQLCCEVKCRGTGFRQLYTWLAKDKVDLLIVCGDRQPPLVITSFALATQVARAAQHSRVSGSAPAYPAKRST
jgi:hypothetical protein